MAPRLRRKRTDELSPADVEAIRALMTAAFGTGDEGFDESDWDHALGGTHFVLDVEGEIVSHASVVERSIEIDGRALRAGYVEAVATHPARQGEGHGSAVMATASEHIREQFELGALGTGRHAFYGRLGWETWRGPAYVLAPTGRRRTPGEEGYILVLRTPSSPSFSLTGTIACDWRLGDVW